MSDDVISREAVIKWCNDHRDDWAMGDDIKRTAARYSTLVEAAAAIRSLPTASVGGGEEAALEQLRAFVAAKRFDREAFQDDTAMVDWMLSRARHVIANRAAALLDARAEVEKKTICGNHKWLAFGVCPHCAYEAAIRGERL